MIACMPHTNYTVFICLDVVIKLYLYTNITQYLCFFIMFHLVVCYHQKLCKHCVSCYSTGENGDEVLYGTSDGKVGLVQLSR